MTNKSKIIAEINTLVTKLGHMVDQRVGYTASTSPKPPTTACEHCNGLKRVMTYIGMKFSITADCPTCVTGGLRNQNEVIR